MSGHSVIVWIDGALVPLADAQISPLDHGLTVGDGVFETLRVYDGVPFAWTPSLSRVCARRRTGSDSTFPTPTRCAPAAEAVLAANGLREARLRITVTGGPAPPGLGRGDPDPRRSRTSSRSPIEPAAPTADVVIAPWTRNERGATAGLKTISYAANVARARLRRGTRRERGDLREHPGQPVRGDRLERVPRARRDAA